MAGNKRARPSEGFYKALNSLSSADLELNIPKQSKQLKVYEQLPDGIFKVERLVAQRLRGNSMNL